MSATCAGCGEPLAPSQAPGVPRKWCTDRCRKRTLYNGVCEICGGSTNGYNGIGTAPKVCQTCLEWSEDAILDAIHRWAEEHGGIPPTCTEWRTSSPSHPAATTVRNVIGGWNEALLRAGFGLKCDRRPETQELVERMLRDGHTVAEVADAIGTGADNIYMRLRTRGLRVRDLRVAA